MLSLKYVFFVPIQYFMFCSSYPSYNGYNVKKVGFDLGKYVQPIKKLSGSIRSGRSESQNSTNAKEIFSDGLSTKDNSLSELLALLKKGTDIKSGVERPQADNMSWFQIKIPKNK
ncbi:unnamed protein product [Leptidea sinapis]|uniref:Uncharacterized protein n=1 Tax=Leptidea sinapis TaxID=189913 RepID=A0A5E4QW76_9NEOP|nr:unnamed protein product [Leptidea sinapis]